MILHTSSEGISFAKELENESANFYESWSQKYAKGKDALLSFIQENKKNITQIERAYYEVISDAVEGGFAFNIDTNEYKLETSVVQNATYSDYLKKAIEIEGKIIKFYSDAARQSEGLMADVHRTFIMVSRKRKKRTSQLQSIF